jgi:hypothetical protein
MDPAYLIWWPGALAIAAFAAMPVGMVMTRLYRRLGRARNRSWRCGRCNRPLASDDVDGQVFAAHGVHVCSNCADVYRRRYHVAFLVVPTIAVMAGAGTLAGVILDPRPLSWYAGLPVFSLGLPSLGIASAFWWRVQAAKQANLIAKDATARHT